MMMYRSFEKVAGTSTGIDVCPNCHMTYHTLTQTRYSATADCHLCTERTQRYPQENFVCQGCATYVHPTLATTVVEYSEAA